MSYPRAWLPSHGGGRRQLAVERRTSGLNYRDLQKFPDDLFRREIIDVELIGTPAPGRRHQHAAFEIAHVLNHYVQEHGGEVLSAPIDVRLSDVDVVQPDVMLVRADRVADLGDESFVRVARDLM